MYTTIIVGFKLGATGAGHADPNASWTSTRSSSGGTNWSGEKRVVSLYKGLKIEFRRVFGSAEVIEAKWRGPDEGFIVEGLDGEKSCEVQVGFLGDD
ncbi:hypothetical protein DPV78_004240 [Talaromyces pinophilus]|nr:hypothetical protein DPV78_004240 [Talaromyces pinophilus]